MHARYALVPALLAALVVVPPAFATPRGKVEMKDGRVFDPVDYEIKGNKIRVVLPIGEAEFSMDMVKGVTPGGAVVEGGEGAEAVVEPPSARDWEGRFELEPPPGWVVAPQSSPLARAELRHAERSATFVVYLRPVEGEVRPEAKVVPKDVMESITADLNRRYARCTSGRTTLWSLFDSPVVRIDGIQATPFGEKTPRKVTEVRFRRGGLEYSLTYTVAAADEGALVHDIDKLFESFSFLPTVSLSPEGYSDLGRGFALTRPNEDWQLQPAPFEVDEPLRMVTGAGAGKLVVSGQAGTDAKAVVANLIRARKTRSAHCQKEQTEEADLRGTPIVRFSFEDFRPEDKKGVGIKGFAASVGAGRVLVFLGEHALTDANARKVQADLEATLASVRLKDDERIRAGLNQANDVMALIKQGIDAQAQRRAAEAVALFDQAVTAFPTYARAYYLRALAKRDAQDMAGYREDAQRAAELEPGAGYDDDLANSYEREATIHEQKKEFAEACRLWVSLFRRSRSEPHKRKVLSSAGSIWSAARTAKEPERGLQSVERELRSVQSEPAVQTFLITTYREGALALARDGEFATAKRWAGKIRGVSNEPRVRADVEKLIDQINQQQDRARGR